MKYDLLTSYGEQLDKNNVLSEYPRPQLRRDSYINLNGFWDYQISKNTNYPENYRGKILVPFPFESILSQAEGCLQPDDYLIYRRFFQIPDGFHQGRILLHFGAVDQISEIHLNGKKLHTHVGGYLPFTLDITAETQKNNELIVIVQDPTDSSFRAFGKQTRNPQTIWYTPVTGIWQTVWLESVPENYLKDVKISTDFEENTVHFTLDTTGDPKGQIRIFDQGRLLCEQDFQYPKIKIKIDHPQSWSPETPHLYDFSLRLEQDFVQGYFAFRKFSIGEGPYGPCLFLNNQPYFINGVLDQGYFSDGLYTPASDQAYIDDILAMKNLGYNTLRKHIKIEPLRYYYHCDRLGMIVWQDMVNGGCYNFWKMTALPTIGFQKISDERKLKTFGRGTPESQKAFAEELRETVDHLYNLPSIGLWTIFNEGWGQFRSAYFYRYLRDLDSTRIIDSASGWFDQGAPDLASKHIYFRKVKIKKDRRNRPVVLSEFGGYSYGVKNHCYSDKEFGYKKFTSLADFQQALQKLYEEEIIPNLQYGLAAAIYTQLSDVEEEINGILTYDRKVCKLHPDITKPLFEKLKLYKKVRD
jgi:beta-galactosidase/beta-glucuronidase